MRRLAILLSAVLIFGGGLSAASHLTRAQDDATAIQYHVLVGAWLAYTDASDTSSAPSVLVFHGDGTYTETTIGDDGGEETSQGVWQPTGEFTADLTIVNVIQTGASTYGTLVVRASVEVSEDGSNFTASYTIELLGVGTTPGQYGPGSANGTRISVEPMGTPVGPMDQLFGQFEEEASPEATPAA